MKTIAATKFKAECMAILDQIGPEGVVITKHGKPVATVLPYREPKPIDFIGALKDKMKIKGDIFSTGRRWNAQK